MSSPVSAEDYLGITCSHSPVIDRTIREYGNVAVAEFLKDLAPEAGTPFQPRSDLVEEVYRYAASLLDEPTAKTAAATVGDAPVVLTANHHGVDFFAQSFQGSLLFYLFKRLGNRSDVTTVPIFACGSVPLDNLTYPLGLLLYHTNWNQVGSSPSKLPIFSNRFRRVMVSVAGALDEAMVQRAETRFAKMVQEKQVSPTLAAPVHKMFRDHYCARAVKDLSTYSDQSVVLNNRVWKWLFAETDAAPEVVYLELETIVSMLLERDLQNSKSLAWCIMFEPMLREAVFKELDGARACWSIEGLARRSCSDQPSQAKAFYGCGTQFFWGINARGRRVPLCLQSSGQNKQVLRGIDDRGDHWELCYTPQAILEALREKRLLPSLFTCFLVLSFARGVTCAGGYFQGEYLPRMQEGLANALRTQAGYEDVANLVESVASYTYLSGMQAVMVRIKDDALIPAGPMEILAAGGLTDSDIQKILSLPVRDAHLASLFETVPDVAGWVIKSPAWKKSLAENCYRLLEDKVVIK